MPLEPESGDSDMKLKPRFSLFSKDITLNDGTIALKPHGVEELPLLWGAVQESVAWAGTWLPWASGDLTLERERLWLTEQQSAWREGRASGFAIWTADRESYLGAVGLNYVDWAQRRANVGYWVRTSRIGQGIAPAAMGLLKQFAFSALDLEYLDVLVNPANLASRRVAEKAGAVEKGTIPNPLSPERGQPRIWYVISRNTPEHSA